MLVASNAAFIIMLDAFFRKSALLETRRDGEELALAIGVIVLGAL